MGVAASVWMSSEKPTTELIELKSPILVYVSSSLRVQALPCVYRWFSVELKTPLMQMLLHVLQCRHSSLFAWLSAYKCASC